MPYNEDSPSDSFEMMLEAAADPNEASVGLPMIWASPHQLCAVAAVGNGVASESKCSLSRGEIVLLVRNSSTVPHRVVLEIRANTASASCTTRSGGDTGPLFKRFTAAATFKGSFASAMPAAILRFFGTDGSAITPFRASVLTDNSQMKTPADSVDIVLRAQRVDSDNSSKVLRSIRRDRDPSIDVAVFHDAKMTAFVMARDRSGS